MITNRRREHVEEEEEEEQGDGGRTNNWRFIDNTTVYKEIIHSIHLLYAYED